MTHAWTGGRLRARRPPSPNLKRTDPVLTALEQALPFDALVRIALLHKTRPPPYRLRSRVKRAPSPS